MDIWVAYRTGGVWSEPENLGAQINTEGEEVFPFIHADGTLYKPHMENLFVANPVRRSSHQKAKRGTKEI